MILAATLRSRMRMIGHTLLPHPGRRAPRGAVATRVALILALALGVLAFLVMRELLSLLGQAGGSLRDAASLIAVLANLTLAGLLVFDLNEGGRGFPNARVAIDISRDEIRDRGVGNATTRNVGHESRCPRIKSFQKRPIEKKRETLGEWLSLLGDRLRERFRKIG